MTEKQRMLEGKLYNPYRVEGNEWEKSRKALKQFNSLAYEFEKEQMAILKAVFGALGDDAYIEPPFYCDKGAQIYIGNHFYANTGLLILDEAKVEIGDHVFIGPRVSIYTACHPIDASVRNTGLEYAKEVMIGNNVWIGGDVVINPGVHIGRNVVIGSGTVVTKDIPDNMIAAGNPCRVIREVTLEDKAYWEQQNKEYFDWVAGKKH
ncbi:maltose acetyltransferase [Enterocloster clostridioformis]|uniref:sugar O-acetyltransferase n=1 Tax=Enterocloster clostridioformis TaxID=1531 RepID=UPI00080C9481|nr:sugar O-acetyltransferase [Enterocloster clostridioformis]ANU46339.1 hypothetical protein A4V08_11545 [Lachnoclostridium sp. YL32]NDO31200.1 sugar O-acetyltransferase [Enterocloster clostridioformis]OXE65062.1 maltose acetyltransferase [Enterocloster clostridioformis]QQQ98935.1 sugar O-acetyltransferase [Enterocloster clostridioformis]